MANWTVVLLLSITAFLAGSFPFSVWLGRWFAQADIRHYGDGNPGAANAWQAGGWRIGLAALLLDYTKGLLPVGLAHFGLGLNGGGLVIIALMPILGHAYSPWLKFRGGKALAVTFGSWTGLTLGEVPLILGLFLALFLLVQTNHGWAVILGNLGLIAYLLQLHPDSFLIVFWAASSILLIWKYRSWLRSGLLLRPLFSWRLRRKLAHPPDPGSNCSHSF
jgi:glycerol-3-phosphate acyltransferase PlsY